MMEQDQGRIKVQWDAGLKTFLQGKLLDFS